MNLQRLPVYQHRSPLCASWAAGVDVAEQGAREETEDLATSMGGSRKMSPIGSEIKGKRSSQGSDGGYFGLSSASSSESEEAGVFKNPPTGSLLRSHIERRVRQLA